VDVEEFVGVRIPSGGAEDVLQLKLKKILLEVSDAIVAADLVVKCASCVQVGEEASIC